MDKTLVKDFFDSLAEHWDALQNIESGIIEKILDYAGIEKDCSVLDAACGTGVLFPYYLKREVRSAVAADISEKMCAQAAKKCNDERIKIICADILDIQNDIPQTDCCIVFNAFPHLGNAEKAICALCTRLCPDGILTVAHSESRKTVNKRHKEKASGVSYALSAASELAEIFARYTKLRHIIDDDSMYLVSGRVKAEVHTGMAV